MTSHRSPTLGAIMPEALIPTKKPDPQVYAGGKVGAARSGADLREHGGSDRRPSIPTELAALDLSEPIRGPTVLCLGEMRG